MKIKSKSNPKKSGSTTSDSSSDQSIINDDQSSSDNHQNDQENTKEENNNDHELNFVTVDDKFVVEPHLLVLDTANDDVQEEIDDNVIVPPDKSSMLQKSQTRLT